MEELASEGGTIQVQVGHWHDSDSARDDGHGHGMMTHVDRTPSQNLQCLSRASDSLADCDWQ